MPTSPIKLSKEQLKEAFDALEPAQISDSNDFKGDVIRRYQAKALSELTELFDVTGAYDESLFVERLSAFLEKNWRLVNGTFLSYSARPNDPLTQFMVKASTYLASFDDPHDLNETQKALKVLMPTVHLKDEMGFVEGNTEWHGMSVTEVLKTHILGREGKYLVPIRLLEQLNTFETGIPRLGNVYFDYNSHDAEMGYISLEEFIRLIEYSEETLELSAAKKDLDQLQCEDSHLLGQLNILASNLNLNSVNYLGSEEAAGKGGEAAIRQFVKYYKSLPEEDLKRVPEALFRQIRLLHNCIGEYLPGEIRPIPSIETCLATRRDKLKEAMEGHESLLRELSLSEETKDEQLEEAQERLEQATEKLINTIENGSFSEDAHDRLGVNRKLLEALEIELSISNFEELLSIVKPLSPDEIDDFFSDARLRDEAIHSLQSIENFVVLATVLSPEQLKTLLERSEPWLKDQILDEPSDLVAVLLPLTQEKQDLIIKSINQQTSPEEKKSLLAKQNVFANNLLMKALEEPQLFAKVFHLFSKEDLLKAMEYEDLEMRKLLDFAVSKPSCLAEIMTLYTEEEFLTKVRRFDLNAQNPIEKALKNKESIALILEKIPKQALMQIIEITPHSKTTFLHLAAEHEGTLELFKTMVSSSEFTRIIHLKDQYGKTPLHKAARSPENLASLLETLSEDELIELIQEEDNSQYTALHYAVQNPDCLKMIIDRLPIELVRELAQKKEHSGYTAIQLAAAISPSLELLLSSIDDQEERINIISSTNSIGQNLLYRACGNPENVNLILSLTDDTTARALIEQKDKYAQSAFYLSCDYPESLKILSEYYTEDQLREAFQDKNSRLKTCFHRACLKPESLEFICQLFSKEELRQLLNEKDSDHLTPLLIGAENSHSLSIMLEAYDNADDLIAAIKTKDQNGTSTLHKAARFPEKLTQLLTLFETDEERLAAIEEQNYGGQDMFNYACLNKKSLRAILPFMPYDTQVKRVVHAIREGEINFQDLPDSLKNNREVYIAHNYPTLDFTLRNLSVTSTVIGLITFAALETMLPNLPSQSSLALSGAVSASTYAGMRFFMKSEPPSVHDDGPQINPPPQTI